MSADKDVKTEKVRKNMNTVVIIGTLTRKPELKKAGETSYTRFSIAVNEYHKGEKSSMFFDVVAFGKNAENITKYLDKGYTLPLTGKLHQDVFTNKDGEKVSSVVIYLDNFTLVTNKVTKDDNKGGDEFVPFN